MDVERARKFLLSLQHARETLQWGEKLVFWVCDKSLGGRMFAMMDLSSPALVLAFAAGQEHTAELCEVDGFLPAPYLARAHWVAAERWDVLKPKEWEHELRAAYRNVYDRLPARTKTALSEGTAPSQTTFPSPPASRLQR